MMLQFIPYWDQKLVNIYTSDTIVDIFTSDKINITNDYNEITL